jgi:hypothetical protein
MFKNCRVVLRVLCLLSLASVAGCKGCGGPEPITPGVDAFQTSTDPTHATGVDFGANPIPADFFCPGSPAFNGTVALRGAVLETIPAGVTGNADTLVERVQTGAFTGEETRIQVKVRSLRLTSVAPITIPCPPPLSPDWRLDVCECGVQPTTEIVAKVDQDCGCGHFDGELKFNTCLRFTNLGTNTVLGPITQEVGLRISNMPWCPRPMPGALQIAGEFTVRDCDGAEARLRGTSNFFPGVSCAEETKDCWTEFANLTQCHEGPSPTHQHCVNPVCGREQGLI